MDIITIAIASAVLVSTVLKILNIRYEKKNQIGAPKQDVNLLNSGLVSTTNAEVNSSDGI